MQCSCGRVVKASDSKSDSLWERRFESCQLRLFYCRIFLDKLKFKKYIAERGFDPRTSGLWAQHASTAPLCSCNMSSLYTSKYSCTNNMVTYRNYSYSPVLILKKKLLQNIF